MGNVNLPTPVALAAGGLCVLGGYLLGAVSAPDTASRTTATVVSYDAANGELCLQGDSVEDEEAAREDVLCGTWRRTPGSVGVPRPGDRFRFVTMTADRAGAELPSGQRPIVVIYGDVVPG